MLRVVAWIFGAISRLGFLKLIALVAVVTLAACAEGPTGPGSPPASGSVVPFGQQTYEPTNLPSTYAAAPEALPACVLSDAGLTLKSVAKTPRVAGEPVDSVGYQILFDNVGPECASGAAPTVTLSSPSGAGEPMVADLPGEGESLLPPRWVVTAGSETMQLWFLAGEPCGRFPDETWDLLLQDKGSEPVKATVEAPTCDTPFSGSDTVRSGPWKPFRPQPESTALLTAPTDALKLQIEIPAEVPLGEQIDFTVKMSNPTEQSTSLSPCPAFEQAAGDGGWVRNYDELLNCAQAPKSIGPGQTVPFRCCSTFPRSSARDRRRT